MKLSSKLLAASLLLWLPVAAVAEPRNAVSTEATPLRPGLAPPAAARTYAQTRNADGRLATLLVLSFSGETVQAVDLTPFGAALGADVFDAIAAVGEAGLSTAAGDKRRHKAYPIASLVSPAGEGNRHIASGTNFAEHAKETSSSEVFNFPKFGVATPAVTQFGLKSGVLLDYEVEICVRFDRDLRSAADFDAATKGFFLCGDFTDRATMVRRINPQHVTSGEGFSEAKSGPGYFPTGPFLVVPKDWKAFVARERIVTRVNGELRQDARGGEMILDFRGLTEKAFRDPQKRFTYQGRSEPLIEGAVIPRGSVLMSGTPEGVIFMPPTAAEIRATPDRAAMLEGFIASQLASGRYLKAGDLLVYESSSMGVSRTAIRPAP